MQLIRELKMIFKKLEVYGFKSFAEKTEFHFEPGVSAVIGPNGCGKCITGDSKVLLSDGSVVEIKDLVESTLEKSANVEILEDGAVGYENPAGVNVLSLNTKTFKVEKKPVIAFVKRKSPSFLLKITTRNGRQITTTHYHPFFSIKNSHLYNLKAEELKPGIKIALPRRLPVDSCSDKLDLLDYSERFTPDDSAILTKTAKKTEPICETNIIKNIDPNTDLIPEVNSLIKQLVEVIGIDVEKLEKDHPKLAAYYENRCLPSREGLKEVAGVIGQFNQDSNEVSKATRHLRRLSESDILWDEIACIERVQPEKWVYDLCVATDHNFIANGMIVHNTNVADAIKWVLGEQSAKSVRGTKMEDVIFNGTVNKEPVNMAEVSLTLSNQEKFLPIDYDEVTITRRVFRSGEGEYLLNKTPVRLKDITELLMGTGIGTNNYFLMEQGKLDRILSYKPEERRSIFEEASGITKYKSKKKEALRKLEQTEDNILRVNDIITEVKRQIGSIERQAQKARRYQRLFDELKAKEVKVSNIEYCQLLEDDKKSNERVQNGRQQETELSNKLEAASNELRQARSNMEQIDENISRINSEALRLDSILVKNKDRIQLDSDRIEELQRRIKEANTEIERSKIKVDSLKVQVEDLRKKKDSVFSEKDLMEKTVEEKQGALDEISKSIEEANLAIQNAKQDILEETANLSKLKNEASRLLASIAGQNARMRRLAVEKESIAEDLSNIQTRADAINGEVAACLEKANSLRSQKDTLLNRKEHLEATLKSLEENSAEVQTRSASIKSRVEFLKQMVTEHEGFSDGVKILFKESTKELPWFSGVYGVLADLISLPES